jgi:hypothetical protein
MIAAVPVTKDSIRDFLNTPWPPQLMYVSGNNKIIKTEVELERYRNQLLGNSYGVKNAVAENLDLANEAISNIGQAFDIAKEFQRNTDIMIGFLDRNRIFSTSDKKEYLEKLSELMLSIMSLADNDLKYIRGLIPEEAELLLAPEVRSPHGVLVRRPIDRPRVGSSFIQPYIPIGNSIISGDPGYGNLESTNQIVDAVAEIVPRSQIVEVEAEQIQPRRFFSFFNLGRGKTARKRKHKTLRKKNLKTNRKNKK